MKKLWNQNRVVCVLCIILVICFTAIVGVTISFFYSNKTGKYGSRLEEMEKYPFTEEVKNNLKEYFEKDEMLESYKLDSSHGRIMYFYLTFKEDAKLDKAKKLVEGCLELIPEDLQKYYDLSFTMKSVDNFTIFGVKNAVISEVVWNNNREVETEDNEK